MLSPDALPLVIKKSKSKKVNENVEDGSVIACEGKTNEAESMRVSRAEIKEHRVKIKNFTSVSEVTSKEGYLDKASKSVFTSWKRKYCVIKESSFICFKGKVNGVISCRIDFDKLNVELYTKGREFTMMLTNNKRFTFRSRSMEVKEEWIELIRKYININTYLLKIIPMTPKYWKVNYFLSLVQGNNKNRSISNRIYR